MTRVALLLAVPLLLGAAAPDLPGGAIPWRRAGDVGTPSVVRTAYEDLLRRFPDMMRWIEAEEDAGEAGRPSRNSAKYGPDLRLFYIMTDLNGDQRPEIFLQVQQGLQCYGSCLTYVMTRLKGRWHNFCWFEGNNRGLPAGYTGIIPARSRRHGWREFAWYALDAHGTWPIVHRYTWRRSPLLHRDGGCVSRQPKR